MFQNIVLIEELEGNFCYRDQDQRIRGGKFGFHRIGARFLYQLRGKEGHDLNFLLALYVEKTFKGEDISCHFGLSLTGFLYHTSLL